jgi:hypothetical protein
MLFFEHDNHENSDFIKGRIFLSQLFYCHLFKTVFSAVTSLTCPYKVSRTRLM